MEQSATPWGKWFVLEDGEHFKVKRIEVLPGKRLSYQKHFRRQEHWYVVQGQAKVTIDGHDHLLAEGASIDINKEAFHRIENTGSEMLIVIEVQTGTYFGEDDIVRTQDDYGRAST